LQSSDVFEDTNLGCRVGTVIIATHLALLICRLREVPITFTERRQGASKLSGGVVWESALLPWRLAARGRL
jgi:hypothetical protein